MVALRVVGSWGGVGWKRVVAAALAANVTSLLALGLLFGNALIEPILYTDVAGQSPKVLAVFFELEPLPAVSPLWDSALQVGPRGLAVRGLLLWSFGLVAVFAVGMAPRRVGGRARG